MLGQMDERTGGAAVFLAGLVLFVVALVVVLGLVFGTGRTL
jgi:hypothetical protein